MNKEQIGDSRKHVNAKWHWIKKATSRRLRRLNKIRLKHGKEPEPHNKYKGWVS